MKRDSDGPLWRNLIHEMDGDQPEMLRTAPEWSEEGGINSGRVVEKFAAVEATMVEDAA